MPKSKLLLLPLPPPLHLLVLLLNEAFSLGKWVRLIRLAQALFTFLLGLWIFVCR